MMRWFRLAAVAAVALVAGPRIVPPVRTETPTAYAAPLDQGCRSHTWQYDPGKTPEGFKAHASDGCNVVDWTGNTTDTAASGTLTFKTMDPAFSRGSRAIRCRRCRAETPASTAPLTRPTCTSATCSTCRPGPK